MIDEILAYNKQFVEKKGYEEYITNKYPDKKIAILSCMDTRLTALLPAALGIKNGDVKMIKNAGGVISHPFGSVIRSLLVAIFELGVYWAVTYEQELFQVITPEVMLIVCASVLVFGIVITWLCAYFSMNKYLRMKANSLYYI